MLNLNMRLWLQVYWGQCTAQTHIVVRSAYIENEYRPNVLFAIALRTRIEWKFVLFNVQLLFIIINTSNNIIKFSIPLIYYLYILAAFLLLFLAFYTLTYTLRVKYCNWVEKSIVKYWTLSAIEEDDMGFVNRTREVYSSHTKFSVCSQALLYS